MALQKDVTLDNGIFVPGAYHKVTLLQVTALGTGINAIATVTTYLNQQLSDLNAPPILIKSYNVENFDIAIDTVSAGLQIYSFLKTLDDFAGATDV